MQQMELATELGGAERKRVEAVVETLATLRSQGDSLAEVAHDARNMVTALGLYCDLLDEPGVLATPFLHYGNELRLVAAASRRLVEKLVAMDSHETSLPLPAKAPLCDAEKLPAEAPRRERFELPHVWDLMPAEPIGSLAGELLANRNLLAALAGSSTALTVDIEGGALPVRLTGEDLTRVLVNLVKNASEAMPAGGRIQVGLHEKQAEVGAAPWLALTIEDNGPGIPPETLERIFDSGYTSHASGVTATGGWQAAHRGLGLSITRSIVEAAGGRIHAANRAPAGARFEIELPVRSL
jgi:two-component system sensor histidine kinase ChvG